MDRFIRIEITAEDIAKGHRKVASSCMIARAGKRTFSRARIGYMIMFESGDFNWNFSAFTPEWIKRKIIAFDSGEPVEPFAFTLDMEKQIVVEKTEPKIIAQNIPDSIPETLPFVLEHADA